MSYESDNPNFYKNLIISRDSTFSSVNKSLEIVKKFIIEKKLILKGGLAMDYLLRLKGDSIYDDSEVPDFDFLSYKHSAHAYELGSILCKLGFEDVSVIQGFHLTTMRVRVMNEPVADITYCPEGIFNSIDKTKHFQGIILIDTMLQQIDQHRALSLPFENSGPSKVIYSRWLKDMTRYDLLYKYYPVDEMNKKISFKTVKVNISEIRNMCLCGFSGFSDSIKFTTNFVHITLPEDYTKITVASFKKPEKYLKILSSFMGTVPAKYITKKLEIYHTRGQLLSAKKTKSLHNVYIANPQFSMMLMLIYIIKCKTDKNTNTDSYRYAYKLYHKYRQKVKNGDGPSIEIYGNLNFTESEENSMRQLNEKLSVDKKKIIQYQPKSIYFKKSCLNEIPTFDYTASPYFKMDEKEISLNELPPEIIKDTTIGKGEGKKHNINDPMKLLLDEIVNF